MRKLFILLTSAALFFAASCNKDDKLKVEQLQRELESLQQQSVAEVTPAEDVLTPDGSGLAIVFDKAAYGIDAGGSVTVHYTLTSPASLNVTTGEGWSATITPAGETEGDITVTAPDPASPGILQIAAVGNDGVTAGAFVQILVRRPYTNVPSPRIESLAYNGLRDIHATQEHFQKIVDAGMTMLTVEGEDEIFGPGWRAQCLLAEQVGLKVILFINYTAGLYSDDPENFKGLDELVNEAKQYPAVCAYQIADEPSTVLGHRLAVTKQRINELDPDRPVYINLHPCGVSPEGMGATTYAQYVEYFASVCNLEFISFDQYPVYLTGVQDEWYEALDVVSSTAKLHGVPFWAFLLCSRIPRREDPTLENMRLQGNINLAYGAQCNQFFVWKCLSDSDYAPFMNDGTYKEEAYNACRDYNREMHNREFVFAGCDVRTVRHIGRDYYLHGKYLNKSDLPEAIAGITADGSAVVSFLGNSGNEYVAVCNKSWQEKLTVDIDFTRSVFTIDREGEFSEHQPGTSRFTIDEGDMLVIKWK